MQASENYFVAKNSFTAVIEVPYHCHRVFFNHIDFCSNVKFKISSSLKIVPYCLATTCIISGQCGSVQITVKKKGFILKALTLANTFRFILWIYCGVPRKFLKIANNWLSDIQRNTLLEFKCSVVISPWKCFLGAMLMELLTASFSIQSKQWNIYFVSDHLHVSVFHVHVHIQLESNIHLCMN